MMTVGFFPLISTELRTEYELRSTPVAQSKQFEPGREPALSDGAPGREEGTDESQGGGRRRLIERNRLVERNNWRT
jgi:hypothetical protein